MVLPASFPTQRSAMFRCLLAGFVGVIALALVGLPSLAQDKKDPPKKKERIAIADPEKVKTDPDFLIQGEYEGIFLTASKKAGAQVVAKGEGKFDVKIYPGGLPGAGWDGKPEPIRGTATRSGAEARADVILAGTKDETLGIITSGTNGGMSFTLTHKNHSGGLSKIERKSKTLGEKPPVGALVLFGGPGDEKNWEGGKIVEYSDGKFLNMGIKSKAKFGAFKAHVEFRLPWMPNSSGQGRGNSGVYLQDRYELQVLDSFGLNGENNECGGFYTLHKPSVNMCFPPLVWQTYDIEFTPAEFGSDGKKTKNARATVYHNGVKIQDNVELKNPTGGGQAEAATPGPFQLQNHGDPLAFNNIWVVTGAEQRQ